jgi:Tfp pilus assembly protein PilZ
MTSSENERKYLEKRQYPRKSVKTDLGYATVDDNCVAIIENISNGGAFISAPDLGDVGQDITMDLDLPEEQKALKMIGEIVWADQKGVGVKFKMGFDASLLNSLIDSPRV